MGGSLLDEKTTWEEFGKGLRLGNFIQSERSKQSLWYFIVSLDTNQTHRTSFNFDFILNESRIGTALLCRCIFPRFPDSSNIFLSLRQAASRQTPDQGLRKFCCF